MLDWFDRHGRHDLPWQQDITPYRVWVSEIMLQQTQVSTVIPYFQRFMQHFPDVQALAAAPQDEVLHLWTGLGYYARARNLHKAAKMVVEQFAGSFPADPELLGSLPGIGRSTAGAILAISLGQRGVILDGNVKRVLCRYHAIQQWPGTTVTQKLLWLLADAATPTERVADYTQAIMDLGATLCSRSKPDCESCPLNRDCMALKLGITGRLPVSKPKRARPEKQVLMVICRDPGNRILLQQRQSVGIWGGLWSFPECQDEAELDNWLAQQNAQVEQRWPSLRHTFSHFHLDITPVLVNLRADSQIADSSGILWYQNGSQAPAIGLAAPVKKLLERLAVPA